jgi:hypothetical protein
MLSLPFSRFNYFFTPRASSSGKSKAKAKNEERGEAKKLMKENLSRNEMQIELRDSFLCCWLETLSSKKTKFMKGKALFVQRAISY